MGIKEQHPWWETVLGPDPRRSQTGGHSTRRAGVGAGHFRCAAQEVSPEAPSVIVCDDSTKKKAGKQIEGVACYRNGAGSARQEYRTLRGLICVPKSREAEKYLVAGCVRARNE